MKKSNRKGFISISVVYAFLILFLLLLLAIVESYSSRQNMLNKIVEETKSELEGEIIDLSKESVDFKYTGNYQMYQAPKTGYYKIELWGAQGAAVEIATTAGKGAYVSGKILLNQGDKIYFYVGKQGYYGANDNVNPFNGGGFGSSQGGGATDVRLVKGTWNNSNGLKSRIMVAGGGGGSVHSNSASYIKPTDTPGHGGTLFGIDANFYAYDPCGYGGYNFSGHGGTQTSGGKPGTSFTATSTIDPAETPVMTGTFGIGGYSVPVNGNTLFESSGGGGGYYGGGHGNHPGCTWTGGGGGSSFISGYAGVNALNSDGTHSHNTKHYSNKYFIDGEMQAGVNSGNGKAKITYLGSNEPTRTNTNLNSVQYIKDCMSGGSSASSNNVWSEIQAIKDGINIAKEKEVTINFTASGLSKDTITDGEIKGTDSVRINDNSATQYCAQVDLGITQNLDEIAVWHWADGRTFYNNTTSVSSDGENWTTVINTTEAETANGKRVNAWD